jgi:hypothetical protein
VIFGKGIPPCKKAAPVGLKRKIIMPANTKNGIAILCSDQFEYL